MYFFNCLQNIIFFLLAYCQKYFDLLCFTTFFGLEQVELVIAFIRTNISVLIWWL